MSEKAPQIPEGAIAKLGEEALSPETLGLRDSLHSQVDRVIDWVLENSDHLPPHVELLFPKEGKVTANLRADDALDNEEIPGVTLSRDDVVASANMGGVNGEPEASMTVYGLGELPGTYTKSTLIFLDNGLMRVEPAYEEEVHEKGIAYVYKPLEAYDSRPAKDADLEQGLAELHKAVRRSGLPKHLSMRGVKQKPTSVLEAQQGSFLKDGLNDIEGRDLDRYIVASNIIGRTMMAGEGVTTEDLQARRAELARQDYPDHLRQADEQTNEAIKVRAELLESYPRFAPAVDRLRADLADGAGLTAHPQFLGGGLNVRAYRIEVDGKSYVMRQADQRMGPQGVEGYLSAGARTKGMPHTEQYVAASYDAGTVVSELAPGKELDKLTPDELREITDEQLEELVDTAIDLYQLDIQIDPKRQNLFYDPEVGFTCIDLSLISERTRQYQTLAGQLTGVAGVLQTGQDLLELAPDLNADSPDSEFERALEDIRVYTSLSQRFCDIADSKLSPADREAFAEQSAYLRRGNFANVHELKDYVQKFHPKKAG